MDERESPEAFGKGGELEARFLGQDAAQTLHDLRGSDRPLGPEIIGSLPIWDKLVDYDEPPEPLREFVTQALPEMSQSVAELPGRELNVLAFYLIKVYAQGGRHHKIQRTAWTVSDYLGINDPPKPPEGLSKASLKMALEQIQTKSREVVGDRAEGLVATVSAIVQSGSLDNRFYAPLRPESDDTEEKAPAWSAAPNPSQDARTLSNENPPEPNPADSKILVAGGDNFSSYHKLVDYPVPSERMVEFVLYVLPHEVASQVTQLSARELTLTTLALIEKYQRRRTQWQVSQTYHAALDYLGIYELPRLFDESKYEAHPLTVMRRIREDQADMTAIEAKNLLAKITGIIQSDSLDNRFYSPPDDYKVPAPDPLDIALMRGPSNKSPPSPELSHDDLSDIVVSKPLVIGGDDLPTHRKLVDYPVPGERMVQFVIHALPKEVEPLVSQLSAREITLTSLYLLEQYIRGGNWRTDSHYFSALRYLGLNDLPEPFLEVNLDGYITIGPMLSVHNKINETDPLQAAALLARIKVAAQGEEVDNHFFTPHQLYADGEWLAAREEYFQQLFGDSNESLVSLARRISIARHGETPLSKDQLIEGVSTILRQHDLAARGEGNHPALFGLLDPEKHLERVTALTSTVIWFWERVWVRNNKQRGVSDADNPSPFAELAEIRLEPAHFSEPVVQLVIETAAGVIDTLQTGYPSGNPWSHFNKNVANFIAKRGPIFAAEWASGRIIYQAFQEQGLDTEFLRKFATPGFLTTQAVMHNRDPSGAVERIFHHYHTTLSYENLQVLTGWNEAKVRKVFSPYIRYKIAMQYAGGNPEQAVEQIVTLLPITHIERLRPWKLVEIIVESSNPQAKLAQVAGRLQRVNSLAQEAREMLGWSKDEIEQLFPEGALQLIAEKTDEPLTEIRRIATNYETLLSTSSLMLRFNLTEKRCHMLFPEYTRRRLARLADPIKSTKEVVRIASILTREYDLPERLVANLAGQSRLKRSLDVANIIMEAQADRPPSVNPAFWAWVVASLPRASHAKRLRHLAAHIAILRIIHGTQSLDAPLRYGQSRYEVTGDPTTLDPSTIVVEQEVGSDALEQLQNLAEQAGLTPDQLEALITRFAEGDPGTALEDSDELAALLEKLRQAAG